MRHLQPGVGTDSGATLNSGRNAALSRRGSRSSNPVHYGPAARMGYDFTPRGRQHGQSQCDHDVSGCGTTDNCSGTATDNGGSTCLECKQCFSC